jgi:hypothetical protein
MRRLIVSWVVATGCAGGGTPAPVRPTAPAVEPAERDWALERSNGGGFQVELPGERRQYMVAIDERARGYVIEGSFGGVSYSARCLYTADRSVPPNYVPAGLSREVTVDDVRGIEVELTDPPGGRERIFIGIGYRCAASVTPQEAMMSETASRRFLESFRPVKRSPPP